jgi:hypothetical protein
MHDADVATQVVPAARNRCLTTLIVAVPVAVITTFAAWWLLRPVYTATAILRVAATENPLVFETADTVKRGANASEVYKRTQRQ